MPNTVPYEVIAAPFTLWVAPVGTAFPLIDVAPAVAWVKVGSSGNLNYDDAAGVTVEHSQKIVPWRASGDSGARKTFRTEEDLKIKLKLMDITLEQYALALNHNPVTDVAAGVGVAGYRKIGLSRGFTVATRALLIRGSVSPYGPDDWNSQYEVPIAAQTGNPSVGSPRAGVRFTATACARRAVRSAGDRAARTSRTAATITTTAAAATRSFGTMATSIAATTTARYIARRARTVSR